MKDRNTKEYPFVARHEMFPIYSNISNISMVQSHKQMRSSLNIVFENEGKNHSLKYFVRIQTSSNTYEHTATHSSKHTKLMRNLDLAIGSPWMLENKPTATISPSTSKSGT